MRIAVLAFYILTVFGLETSIASGQVEPHMQTHGLTFEYKALGAGNTNRTALLSCGQDESGKKTCDPYVGDMQCKSEIPLACFLDINVSAPSHMSNQKYWSGGLIALTDSVAASQFKTIKNADAYCAANFGKNWRVASFHDGGGWGIRAYGHAGLRSQRVWLDIKDQPRGTCWAR